MYETTGVSPTAAFAGLARPVMASGSVKSSAVMSPSFSSFLGRHVNRGGPAS